MNIKRGTWTLPSLSVGLFSLMLFACVSLPAQAEETGQPPQEAKQQAKAFFKEGKRLYAEGQYLEAAREFEKAHAIMPSQAVLANIALCFDDGGDIPRAVEAYRRYLESPVENAESVRMRSRLQELEIQVGEILAVCAEPDCQIYIDKALRGSYTGAFVVLPGTYLVEGMVDGRIISQKQTVVNKGGRVTVHLMAPVASQPPVEESLAPPAAEPEAPPATEPEKSPVTEADIEPVATAGPEAHPDEGRKSRLRAPFWIATGFTAVSGVLVISLGAAALSNHNDFVDSDQTDQELAEKGENLKAATNVAIAVACTSAALMIVFAIVDVTQGKKKREQNTVSFSGGPGAGGGIHVQF